MRETHVDARVTHLAPHGAGSVFFRDDVPVDLLQRDGLALLLGLLRHVLHVCSRLRRG